MGNLKEKVALLFILVSRDSGNLLREEFAPLEAFFFLRVDIILWKEARVLLGKIWYMVE